MPYLPESKRLDPTIDQVENYLYEIGEMSDELVRIANALERIADFYERGLHVEIDHAHIDDIGEIHGDVVTHPKQF